MPGNADDPASWFAHLDRMPPARVDAMLRENNRTLLPRQRLTTTANFSSLQRAGNLGSAPYLLQLAVLLRQPGDAPKLRAVTAVVVNEVDLPHDLTVMDGKLYYQSHSSSVQQVMVQPSRE